MTFLETPRFPDNIAFGATVGPAYLTVVNTVFSGRDGRIPAWTQSRVNFDVGRRSMNAADTATIDAFFRAVKGRAYGFRIKDWTDFSATSAQGVMTLTAAPGVYQLGKLYQTGALSETRLIQKPVTGTIVPLLNAAPMNAGAYTLDTTTGLLTTTPIAITGVTVGGPTVVTLSAAIPGIVAGQQLICTGLTGPQAAQLNGLPFTILSISGSAYHIAPTTTGTITPVVGSVAQWQANPGADVLAWSGQFDVPARFDVDEMKKQIMDRNGPSGELIVDWGSIPVIEIRI